MARDANSSHNRELRTNNNDTNGLDSYRFPQLSDLDLALIERLRRDGREGNRALASRSNVNEVTIAARLRRMEEADVMRVVAVTDIRLFGHRDLVFAMCNVTGRSVRHVARDVSKLPEAIAVTICSGRFDLIAALLSRDHQQLAEMFGNQLPSIDGVGTIRGALSLDVLKFDSRWASFSDPGTMPEAQPSETVDEMDLAIIHLLQRNARRSNRSIAAELGVSEGTVRGRIKRMLAERVFRIQAVSNAAAFGFAAHAYVGIETIAGRMDDVAAALASRDDVTELSRTFGEFDFLALLIAVDHDALISAVVDEIALLPGVEHAEIFYGCDSIKHTYAWTWIV